MTSVFDSTAWPDGVPSTMDLLDMALEKDNLGAWARRLDLSAEALRTARSRGRLSPVLAGCLAEELQQDPAKWMVIAALETERHSACKRRMVERFRRIWPEKR